MSAVEEYYNRTQKWYTFFYSDKTSLAIHYGFWNSYTRSRKEALINPYKEIKTMLNPSYGDLILDAGCGVGGASIWLAENTPGKYMGITLSPVQLKLARQYALFRNVEQKVEFIQESYFNTGFPDKTFNGIFGIESFCYSYPKPEHAFSEMFRILKPGGNIIILDCMLLREPRNNEEKKLVDHLYHSVKMDGWCTVEGVLAALKNSGFTNIEFVNKTENIKKSVQDVYLRGLFLSPFLWLLWFMRLVSRTEMEFWSFYHLQKSLYELGLVGYGKFYAQKREERE